MHVIHWQNRKKDHIVKPSQRKQFVGKLNKVLLSEHVAVKYVLYSCIWSMVINKHQSDFCSLVCLILKRCFAQRQDLKSCLKVSSCRWMMTLTMIAFNGLLSRLHKIVPKISWFWWNCSYLKSLCLCYSSRNRFQGIPSLYLSLNVSIWSQMDPYSLSLSETQN